MASISKFLKSGKFSQDPILPHYIYMNVYRFIVILCSCSFCIIIILMLSYTKNPFGANENLSTATPERERVTRDERAAANQEP